MLCRTLAELMRLSRRGLAELLLSIRLAELSCRLIELLLKWGLAEGGWLRSALTKLLSRLPELLRRWRSKLRLRRRGLVEV